eukprot:Pompholyxophrys_sp_v1_NODE_1_length_32789_cov_6.460653.p26 type:complete len:166 gc:universal NODE_1_length_32789_cov_6.460653:14753-15250(+)
MSFLFSKSAPVSITQNPMDSTSTTDKSGITVEVVDQLETFHNITKTQMDSPTVASDNLANMLAVTSLANKSKADKSNTNPSSLSLVARITCSLQETAERGEWVYVYPEVYAGPTCKLDKATLEHFKNNGLKVSPNQCTCKGAPYAPYICKCPSGMKFSWEHLAQA